MIAAVADTHAIHWYIFAHERLSSKARTFIESAAKRGDQIAISSISFVEMVYLIERGRIPATTLTEIARVTSTPNSPFVEISLDLQIARSLAQVHEVPDMPDRIIAATALHLGVPLISRDGKIKLSNVDTIW
jgi:PIN domain nuclease of toxin-antitoxin system